MALSNTAVPKYYGEFRDKVIRGEIPVNEKISLALQKKLDEITWRLRVRMDGESDVWYYLS